MVINQSTEYGTIEHNGETLYLTQQAYSCNGANGSIVYRADAIDCYGNDYRIMWEPFPEWIAALAVNDAWCDDESNACDWAHPESVEQV